MTFDIAVQRALQNIAKFGDTDVFPFLFERHVFFDQPSECKNLLLEIHANFEASVNNHPPTAHQSLAQVGYTGFRWATQIEPFWNAYYLALVLSLADQIENNRIPVDDRVVFSYRYDWSEHDHKLFRDLTWNDYRRRCMELSETAGVVVLTDISDFYPRIYHHRLENELKRLPSPGDVPKRIMRLLNSFSKNVSYGLPIGGPASRMLSELALNAPDRHLRASRISFCRYADDYALFCTNRSDAYTALVLLSQKLFNEGLVLQKTKTRILSADEFYETCKALDPQHDAATDEEKLLNISIRFDPYSETPEEDYEKLATAVAEVNVLGILAREIAKTVIDTTVTKQAINAIRAMAPHQQVGALMTMLDQENLDVLSPVFVTLMRAVRGTYDSLPDDHSRDQIDEALVRVYEGHEHILRVDINLSFYLQALARRFSSRKEEIFVDVYHKRPSPILRRIIISAMANWGCYYWLSDLKSQYGSLDEWEKRAVILASYFLTDEGKHWRDHTKSSWNKIDVIIRDWFCNRFHTQRSIPT